MDPQARFEELYRAYADRVHAFARRRTSASVADDVVSDVFVVVWRRLDEVPEDPFPWLLGVARRVLANRRRGDSRSAALHVRLAAGHRSDRTVAHEDVAGEHALAALAGLSERDRELLMLIAWEGLDQAEVAEAIGVRRGTVAVRLHRARQRFAAALAAQDAGVRKQMEVRR